MDVLERQSLSEVKMGRVPTVFKPVAGLNFEMSSFCAYSCNISQFKHLLWYLCSIVNQILAHVIWVF